MKFEYIKRNIKIFFLLTTLIISSCSKNDAEPLFDNDPATRIDNRINELRELLKSSTDGWRATFFTDDTKFGGYTFNFRFKDDRIVEMLSDFSGDGSLVESEYDVNVGATINLVFSSSGLIHDIANNTNEGDFEFLYYGQDGEDLIFRTNRLFKEVRFEKITANDWTNFSDIEANEARINNTTRHFAYEIDGVIRNFSYDVITRFATNFDNSNEFEFGLGFTTQGVKISPAIVVNGVSYEDFVINATNDQMISSDGNFTISIVALPIDLTTILWNTEIDPALNSPSFAQIYAEVEAVHQTVFPTLPLSSTITFGNSNIQYGLGRFIARHGMFFSGVLNNPNLINIRKLDPGFNWRFVTHLNPMLDVIESKSPYEITTISPTESKLTSQGDPDFWFTIAQ